jgi:uncharacterized protein
MHTIRLLALFVILLSFTKPINAQVAYIDSKEVLEKGISQYDSGNYKKALAIFNTINPCDTNYAIAVYEKVLCLSADSSYDQAMALAKSGLKLHGADKRDFYLAQGAIYDFLKQSDSAIALYESLKKLYPNDNLPYYEEAIVYYRDEKIEKAIDNFQQSLLINPHHFKSHYMLGLMYAMQGRITESFIAYNISLLMTQSAEMAKKAITPIAGITDATDEVIKLHDKKNEKYSNPLFDEIDQLILSKLALGNNYELKMSVKDNIFKQLQATIEKLKYDAADNNFAMQFYVPVLTNIYQDELFEPFVLLLYSGFGFEQIDAQNEKKKKLVDKAREVVFPYFNNIQNTRVLNYKQRQTAQPFYHYFPNDNLIITGKSIKTEKEENFVGDVTFFRGNHTIKSKGKYNNKGEREGWWTNYYTNENLLSKIYYKANTETDTNYNYYINGNLKKMIILDAKGEATKEYVYDFGGWLSTVREKIDEKSYSEKSYFANGLTETELIYVGKDLKDGTYNVYYDNGKLKRQFAVLNGKTAGPSKSYFDDGSPNIISVYADGYYDGAYLAYYKGGSIKEKSTFSKGEHVGDYEEYYESGKLQEKGTYGPNNLKESLAKYTEAGNIFCTMKLKNNVLTSIKFMDEANHVTYEKENANGLFEYPIIYGNGVNAVDMKINDKGHRNGVITFYYSTGSKSEVCNYNDGDMEGKSINYFKNGKIKSEINYAKDQLDGYYKTYYYNGQLYTEGWYKEGKRQGTWLSYNVNGTLQSNKYYQDDEINGYLKQFNIYGQSNDKYLYQFGMPVGIVCYDTTGAQTDSVYFGTRNGKVSFSYNANKKIKGGEFNVKNGSFHGEVKFWHNNGQLKKQEYFRLGKKDSISISYYPDGKVKSKGTYHDGDKVGTWLNYNELGDLVKEDNFNQRGELDGYMTGYANKVMHVKYHFTRGSKDGEQCYYGDNGRVAFKLIFYNGDLTGYTYEGKDGKMVPEIKLKNGTGKLIAYYNNGIKSGEAEFVENAITGCLKVYFTNGKLAEERNYKDYDLNGPFRRYNLDGTLVYDADYKNDEILGVEKTFDNAGKLVISANYYYGENHGLTTVFYPATTKSISYNYHYGLLTTTSK